MEPLQRPPKSAAEINAIATLGNTQCHAFVRERGSQLAPETLVYVMREAKQSADTVLFELAGSYLLGRPAVDGRWLGGHCESIIVNLAIRFGFRENLERRVEFRSGCLAALLRDIHAGCEKKGYWEERFGDAFRKTCIDVAKSMVAFDSRHTLGEDSNSDADIDWVSEVPDPASLERENDALAIAVRRDRDSHLLNAVRALPPRQRRAAFLHYFDGLTITGAGVNTVAAVMDISEAAVHKLLKKARARLASDTSLEGIWPEED